MRPLAKAAKGAMATARALAERLRSRPDSEHEQAAIRVAIGLISFLYILYVIGYDAPHSMYTVALTVFFFLFSLAVFLLVLWRPGVSHARRILGVVGDIFTANVCLILFGEAGAPFYAILLWVIFGNGFRFGLRYLILASALSFIGFCAVFLVSPFWGGYPALSSGLLLGLVLLPTYISFFLKKLTQERQRAEDASQAKSSFLANISHEVRTPLNGIIVAAELLEGTLVSHRQKECAETIRSSARTLLAMLDNILDLSRIEAGKFIARSVEFDLRDLLRDESLLFTPQAFAKGLRFHQWVDPSLPHKLRGDPELLSTVLNNLLGNAIKFTERGEVMLTLERLPDRGSFLEIRFAVYDTGIGIPPEAQGTIFDRFSQADNSIRKRFGGTGLGVSIAKQLVELMGGAIGFQSEVGKGTSFWFHLTFPSPQESEAREVASHSRRQRLLLVRPPENAIEVTSWLSEGGFSVEMAPSAEAAFARLVSARHKGVPFDAAIVFQENPLDGSRELVSAVGSDPQLQGLALFLAADGVSEEMNREFIRQGFHSVLPHRAGRDILLNALGFALRSDERDAQVIPFPAKTSTESERSSGLNILLAEDNLVNQRVFAMLIEGRGHRLRLAGNGEEALDALKGNNFDIILLDIHMPDMDGIELAQAIRIILPAGEMPPLIAMTADITLQNREACRRAGFNDFLSKPVNPEKLFEAIDKAVGGRISGKESPVPAPQPFRSHVASELAVLDGVTLRNLETLDTGGGFLESLFHVFKESGRDILRQMEIALEARDVEALREMAHALRSSAGSIGAAALSNACSTLEHAPQAELRVRAPVYIEKVLREFEKVCNCFSSTRASGAEATFSSPPF